MSINQSAEYSDVNEQSLVATRLTVSTSPQDCRAGASNLSGRQTIFLQNIGSNNVWVGPSGTTPTTGMMKLQRNASIVYNQGEDQDIVCQTIAGESFLVVQESA